MTYQEFEDTLLVNISDQLPEQATTFTKPINKNNGVILHGLIIQNGISNISPTIYLDKYYEEYKNGKSINSITQSIITTYKEHDRIEDFDISQFIDYDKCKNHISYRLINYDKNKKLLENVPHIIYLDLAIVFYCLLSTDNNETSSILITNEHTKMWQIETNELFTIASKNTPILLQSDIRDLTDIVLELSNSDIDENIVEEMKTHDPIYLLTNKLKIYGACCILYKELLLEFSKKCNSDLYIIPSSIHEVILIPTKYETDESYLNNLVKEVNSTQVIPEEVLSDHVYYYSKKQNCITYS